jgi:dihydrofolate reductase
MQSPRISIIAALGANRELGKNGDLLWRISADLQRLKQLTTGHTLIMGRKTYDSIGRPLPDRHTIVISRTPKPLAGCTVVTSVNAALEIAQTIEPEEIFIFGGGQIYAACLPFVERLYLTRINATDPEADTFFPDFTADFTHCVERESHETDTPPYVYEILERA